jgi:NAD-dependent dihydropyrimidine dehydrogenase PreA subunit
VAIEVIDPALCNGCGICVRNCPMDVIRMNREHRKAEIRYQADCMLCGQCLECPEKAIYLKPGWPKPYLLGWG